MNVLQTCAIWQENKDYKKNLVLSVEIKYCSNILYLRQIRRKCVMYRKKNFISLGMSLVLAAGITVTPVTAADFKAGTVAEFNSRCV